MRGQLGTGHGANPNIGRPSPEVARLAAGAATTLAVFFWDMHRVTSAAVPLAGAVETNDDVPF